MEATMNRRLKNRPQAELENPLQYVFPNGDIKLAMARSHAALLVAKAALLKAEAASLNVDTIQQCFDAAQEAKAAFNIAEAAMDEAEHRASLGRK
jgi:hypothetical protein